MMINDESYILTNFEYALESKNIKPFFQPIVRTITGEVCAVETLARWEDPIRGLITPNVFIEILEKHDLIHKLDLFMFEEACRIYSEQLSDGKAPVSVSVNFSRIDFTHKCFVDKIISAANKYNIPPSVLCLEITESVMLDNTYLFRKIFDRLHEEGFKIWLDDFGSGYSSLSVIKEYDFDLIKIDMRFLSSMSLRSKKLIAGVINTAKSLGIHTLAEGAETQEHIDYLKEIGCEMIQGYYYFRPMDIKQFSVCCENNTLAAESRENSIYMDMIGTLNYLSADPIVDYSSNGSCAKNTDYIANKYPLAIMELNEGKFSFVYTNEAYRAKLSLLGFNDLEDTQAQINDPSKPFYSGTLSQMKNSEEADAPIRRNYIIGDKYYSLTIRHLATTGTRTMIALSLHVFLYDGIEDRHEEIDRYSRSLLYNFELVNIIDPHKKTTKQIYSNLDFDPAYGFYKLDEGVRLFANNELFPDDKQRYLDFMSLDDLDKRIDKADGPFIQQPFRFRITSDRYEWRCARILRIPKAEGYEYMFSLQKFADTDLPMINCFYDHSNKTENYHE